MKHKIFFAAFGLAAAMIFAAPTKAHAEVFVGVNIGRPVVVARPPVVYVAPRPYYRAYYPRPVVVVPAYAPPARFFYRGRRYARPYAYRPYYGPRYFRR